VRVSAIGSQPRAVRIAALIGAAQGIALATYALALVSFEARSTTTGIKGSDLAPGVLVALYLVFALLVFGVTYWFATGRAAARTPFLLIQAFGLVVAQPLFSGDGSKPVAAGIVIASLVALGCALAPSSRRRAP
jgi:hypothetical protein